MAATNSTVKKAVQSKEREDLELKKMNEEIAAAEKREKDKQAKGVDASLVGFFSEEELAKARALEEDFTRKQNEELAKQRAIEADLDKRNIEAAIKASLGSAAPATTPTATATPIIYTTSTSYNVASSITTSSSGTSIDSKSDDEFTNMLALQNKLNAEEKRKRLAKEGDDNRALFFSRQTNDLSSPYKNIDEEDEYLARTVDFVENSAHHEAETLYLTQCRAARALWNSKMPKSDPKLAKDDKKYLDELKAFETNKAAALALLTEVRHHASVIGEPKEVTSDLADLEKDMYAMMEEQFKQKNRSSKDTKLTAEEQKKIEAQLAKNIAEHKAKQEGLKLAIDLIRKQKNINLEMAVANETCLYQSWLQAKTNAKSTNTLSQMMETFSAELKKFSEGNIEAFVLLGKGLKKPVAVDLSICAHKSSPYIRLKLPELLKLDTYFAGEDPEVAMYNPALELKQVSAEMNAFIKEQHELFPGYKTDAKLAADHKTKVDNIASSFALVTVARGLDNETGAHVEQFISRCWTLAKKMGLIEKTIVTALFSDNRELWKSGIRGYCIPGIVNRLWSSYVIGLTTQLAPKLNSPTPKKVVPAANNTAAATTPASNTGTTAATAVSTAPTPPTNTASAVASSVTANANGVDTKKATDSKITTENTANNTAAVAPPTTSSATATPTTAASSATANPSNATATASATQPAPTQGILRKRGLFG